MENEETVKLNLPEVKKRKRLSIFVEFDSEYAGFGFFKNKKVKTLILGFAILRIMYLSEAQYNRIITVATFSETFM